MNATTDQPQPEKQPEPTSINTPVPEPTSVPFPGKKPKKQKPPTRGERWTDAAQTLMDAVGDLRNAWEEYIETVNGAVEEIKGIQEEFEQWKDNLPENLKSSALGEKLETICAIEFSDIDEPDFDSLEGAAQEALDAEIPLGFGRD